MGITDKLLKLQLKMAGIDLDNMKEIDEAQLEGLVGGLEGSMGTVEAKSELSKYIVKGIEIFPDSLFKGLITKMCIDASEKSPDKTLDKLRKLRAWLMSDDGTEILGAYVK